jgi:PhnB protein
MSAPTIYLMFPGTARVALGYYAETFGGDLALHTYADFGRSDGPADAIAHGELTGTVALSGADAADGATGFRLHGVMFSLLGVAEPALLHEWFSILAAGGSIVDPLARKPWGAFDGQVIDRYGLHWLIGYEAAQ